MKKIISVFLLFLLTGCNDILDHFLSPEPEGKTTVSNFWKTEEDLAASSRELHARFRWCFSDYSVRVRRARALRFDYKSASLNMINNNELEKIWNKNDADINWMDEYKVISTANQIIHYLHAADIPQERINFYYAEALVIRAYTYFYLIQNWGNVPFLTDAFETGEIGQTAWQEIVDCLIEDLKLASALLPPAGDLLDSRGKMITSKQIPSQGTANAILAHVCAWKGSLDDKPALLQEALKAVNKVINSEDYELATTPQDVVKTVLKGNSCEGIFELDFYNYENEYNHAGNCIAYAAESYPVIPKATPATKRRNLRLNFETAERMFNTCGTWFDEIFYKTDSMIQLPSGVTQGAIYIWKMRDKILYEDGKDAGKIRAFDGNELLIRLADMYLLRAELEYKLGDMVGAENDLNVIRDRCQAPRYTVEEGDLLYVIIRQRQQEFFLENTNNDFRDIVRQGLPMVNKMLSGRFKTAKSMDEIYLPIDASAFVYNTKLRQNPYWNQFIAFRIN